MLTMKRLDFTEEQRSFMHGIIQERRMSRVALIRYLVKLSAGMHGTASGDETEPGEQEELKTELKELSEEIINILCAMTDEEYAGIISGME